jgi:hypothetical protein
MKLQIPRNKYYKLLLLILFISCSAGMHVEKKIFNMRDSSENKGYSIYSFGETSEKTIVMFSPVFWKDEILFDHNQSLISYFVSQGYQIFLVSIPSVNWNDGLGLKALMDLQEKGYLSKYTLGGISIGGLRLAKILNKWSPNLTLPDKIFFLGTGFDYNYQSSFANKNLTQINNPISSLFLDPDLIPYWIRKKSYAIPLETTIKIPDSLPIAFFWGKIDSISPDESIYPVYYELPNPKVYKELSIANGLSIDYDHGSLFKSSTAYKEIFPQIVDWIEN